MSRTWEDNAREFAELDQGEGWPFAVLVACSVEKSTRGGDQSKVQSNLGKADATTFAQMAGTTHQRVLRYLEAWEKAAKADLVDHAKDLSPADVHRIATPDANWRDFYVAANPDAGRQHITSAKAAIKKDPDLASQLVRDPEVAKAVVEALTAEQRAELANELITPEHTQQRIQADPDYATRVMDDQDTRVAVAEATLRTSLGQTFERAGEKVDAQAHEQRRSQPMLQSLVVQGKLDSARRVAEELVKAASDLDVAALASEEQAIVDKLQDGAAKFVATAKLVELAVGSAADVNWDAELQKLGAE